MFVDVLKRYWKILVLVAVLSIMATDVYFDLRYSPEETAGDLPVGTSVGELAPEFSGTTFDGINIRLSDHRGKIVVINDFATWCGPCLAETPHLVEAANAYAEKAVFIGLNMQESRPAVESYQLDFQIPYPLVMDPDGRLTELYLPVGLPTTWFIDREGVVRYVYAGPMTVEIIREVIEAIEAGREPDIFSTIK